MLTIYRSGYVPHYTDRSNVCEVDISLRDRPADLDRFSQGSLMPPMIELVEAAGHSQ